MHIGSNHSEESKLKMRKSHLNLVSNRKGVVLSEETKKKMRDSHALRKKLGIKNKNYEEIKKEKFPISFKNPKVSNSKGSTNESRNEYIRIHNWVERNFGKPDICEHCGKENIHGHYAHWANISHEYILDRSDWIRLCAKCHRRYDTGNIMLNDS